MRPVLAKRMKIVCEVARDVLHSMDRAKRESFVGGMEVADFNCCAMNFGSWNGMKLFWTIG